MRGRDTPLTFAVVHLVRELGRILADAQHQIGVSEREWPHEGD
jgi:hypothetical protein